MLVQIRVFHHTPQALMLSATKRIDQLGRRRKYFRLRGPARGRTQERFFLWACGSLKFCVHPNVDKMQNTNRDDTGIATTYSTTISSVPTVEFNHEVPNSVNRHLKILRVSCLAHRRTSRGYSVCLSFALVRWLLSTESNMDTYLGMQHDNLPLR